MRSEPDLRRTCGRGELAPLLYRLGRRAASGLLTLSASTARAEVFALRRGGVVCADGELAKRAASARLARAAGAPSTTVSFEGGISAYPPGALHQLSLAGWVRTHLEAQLDSSLADLLVRELAGVRLTLRADLAPEPLDDTDRRMLAALAQSRRFDPLGSPGPPGLHEPLGELAQLARLARAPRSRLLALLHFLRSVGALAGTERSPLGTGRQGPEAPDPRSEGPADERVECGAPVRADPRRVAARVLGVDAGADLDAVRRAYRRLARALHPDLQPHVDEHRRRQLERRFAELTAAYEALR